MLIGIFYVALYFPMIFPWSKGFSDFDHPVTFSCCRCDWCTSSGYWCSTTSTCSVLGQGPQGWSFPFRMTVDFCLSIWDHPANKNKEQHPKSEPYPPEVSYHCLTWGPFLFFALCVFGVFWNIYTTVFAAGPLARERVWTSRCGSKSRLGLGFLGFMVSVFSWMIMIINRHPPGGFIYDHINICIVVFNHTWDEFGIWGWEDYVDIYIYIIT